MRCALVLFLALVTACDPPPPPPTAPCEVFPPGVCYCGPGCFADPPGAPCQPVDLEVCHGPA